MTQPPMPREWTAEQVYALILCLVLVPVLIFAAVVGQ